MYTMVMMMAMSGAGDAPAFGGRLFGNNGCNGSSCHGSTVVVADYASCTGSYAGYTGYASCNGSYAGCTGSTATYYAPVPTGCCGGGRSGLFHGNGGGRFFGNRNSCNGGGFLGGRGLFHHKRDNGCCGGTPAYSAYSSCTGSTYGVLPAYTGCTGSAYNTLPVYNGTTYSHPTVGGTVITEGVPATNVVPAAPTAMPAPATPVVPAKPVVPVTPKKGEGI